MGSWLVFDWTISVGNITTIAGVMIAIVVFVLKLGTRLDIVEHDLRSIKDSLKEVANNTKQTAVVDGRIAEMEKRLDMISGRVDRLVERGMSRVGRA